jgi:NADH-quinone oxidoreductase subunit N
MIDFFSLLPIVVVLVGAIVVMLLSTYNFYTKTFIWITFGILLMALMFSSFNINSLFSNMPFASIFNNLLIYDSYANTFSFMFILGSILYLGAGENFARTQPYIKGEFFALILFAIFGILILTHANELITALIALEIASYSVYILVGFNSANKKSSEAMFKYLTLGSFIVGFYLLGVALIYLVANSTNLSDIATFIATANYAELILVYIAFSLMLLVFLFKIAVFPFGMWSLDIYRGAPLYVTSFMASVFKIAIFAFFIRIFIQVIYPLANDWNEIFAVLAILTFVIGSLITLAQKNIVKMLAGSSIVHAGYLLLAFMSLGTSPTSVSAIMFYLLSYMLSSIGAFGLLTYLSTKENKKIDTFSDLKGMAKNNPYITILMTIFMLSLAGIPLTIGFIAKFNIFIEAINAGYYALVIVGITAAMVSIYYYMKVILNMYSNSKKNNTNTNKQLSLKDKFLNIQTSHYALSIVAILIIWGGISSNSFIIGGLVSIGGIFNALDISTISILIQK